MITKKNRLFINEYMQCLNGSEAVRRVYPNIKAANRYASVLLSKSDIKAEIEAYSKALVMDRGAIVKAITDISRNAKVESNKLRALELLAKINGIYSDNTNTNIALFQGIMPSKDKVKTDIGHTTQSVSDESKTDNAKPMEGQADPQGMGSEVINPLT